MYVALEKIVISGVRKLKGKVSISGAKNAAVAILPAAALSDGICKIENVPHIRDIVLMCKILEDMGAIVKFIDNNTIEIDPRNMQSASAPYLKALTDRPSCDLALFHSTVNTPFPALLPSPPISFLLFSPFKGCVPHP